MRAWQAQQNETSTTTETCSQPWGRPGPGGYEWTHVSQTLASHVHRGMHLQGRAGTPDGVTRRPTDQCAILRSANETNSLPPTLMATRLPETLEMTCEALVRLDSKPRGSLDAPRAQPTWEVPARVVHGQAVTSQSSMSLGAQSVLVFITACSVYSASSSWSAFLAAVASAS